jgi:hypothetical protein
VRAGWCIALSLTIASAALGQSWLGSFETRRRLTIQSAFDAGVTTLDLSFDSRAEIDAGRLRADCADIRFTADDGVTALPHWLERGCGTPDAGVLVRLPGLVANRNVTYMYWGAPTQPSTSNPSAVALFYDDFATSPRAPGSKWMNVNGCAACFVADGGVLQLTDGALNRVGAGTMIRIDPAWQSGFRVRFNFQMRAVDGVRLGDGIALGVFQDRTSSPTGGGGLGLNGVGYAVEFDTFLGPMDPPVRHLAFAATAPTPETHLAWAPAPYLDPLTDGGPPPWIHADIRVTENTVRVLVDGVEQLRYRQDAGFATGSGAFLTLGGSTGSAAAAHLVDHLSLVPCVDPPPSIDFGAIESRLTSPDAGNDGGPDAAVDTDAGFIEDAGPSADSGVAAGGDDAGHSPPDAGVEPLAPEVFVFRVGCQGVDFLSMLGLVPFVLILRSRRAPRSARWPFTTTRRTSNERHRGRTSMTACVVGKEPSNSSKRRRRDAPVGDSMNNEFLRTRSQRSPYV